MKRAEQWNSEFQTTESTYRQKGESIYDWETRHYKMIQLDAMKEGALRAAKLAEPCCGNWPDCGSEFCNGRDVAAKIILTALEKWTEKDL